MGGQSEFKGMADVKVIGVGGGGCNAVARMLKEQVNGVSFVCVNTDAQALMRAEAPLRIRIGDQVSRGLGVGGDPEKGRQAAEESRDDLVETIGESDMVFLTAGMGGGTGTGAVPVIAEVARSSGALTVAVVTRPFEWEGAHRRARAEEGINRLREKVDTLLVIPNDALVAVCDRKVTIGDAFKLADEVLRRAIQAISDLITVPGDINLDFADVRAVMSDAGSAMMGVGYGKGDNRATDAARAAISNPLLDVSIEGAKGVLFNITGGPDLTLTEVPRRLRDHQQGRGPRRGHLLRHVDGHADGERRQDHAHRDRVPVGAEHGVRQPGHDPAPHERRQRGRRSGPGRPAVPAQAVAGGGRADQDALQTADRVLTTPPSSGPALGCHPLQGGPAFPSSSVTMKGVREGCVSCWEAAEKCARTVSKMCNAGTRLSSI